MYDQSQSSDLLLELKKKARRRLVGALVLALLAATILPLFLESDLKPLGENVRIDIPPISNQPSLPAISTPININNAADNSAQQLSSPNQKEEPSLPSTGTLSANTPADQAKPTSSSVPPTSKFSNSISGAGQIHTDTALTPAKELSNDRFSVQLGVFSDLKKAQTIQQKAKSLGFSATLQKITVAKGTVAKVRIGPFATRIAAENTRDKLREAGLPGFIVTP